MKISTIIKKYLINIKWLVIFPLFRRYFRNNRLNKRLLKNYGGKNVNVSELLKYKNSDKLFILGTGQSINNLSESHFDHINKHDSVGLNGFAYHKFVPTFHSFELEHQDNIITLKMFKDTAKNIFDKIDKYKNTAIIFRQHDIIDDELHNFIKFISGYNNLYWNVYDSIPGRNNINEYAFYLKYFKNIGLFKLYDFFPSSGTSLSWIISMAYVLDYKKIIFCGIDLFGDYFYSDTRPLNNLLFSEKNIISHKTNDFNLKHRIPAETLIDFWQKEFFEPKGTKMYVASKFSLLSKIMPNYWESL